ncbi:hypothetical protein NIASO_01765 [Niabella soli DSM 19437]|uniref:Uncharacterized protein n=1 Tax=Niabella soli DSM 19437 TaxID=929713 RepID=W0F6L9_9BACT|nr:hypothetical protein NIASO_01765 [Niabella soli DSM 19437]
MKITKIIFRVTGLSQIPAPLAGMTQLQPGVAGTVILFGPKALIN